ncbi:zinc finger protein jing homolog [Arachis ipaensis]|uniref:zinc finger protein jing homolog n=1 Tax=Arachis ipaensis TaxID=130454 RepID=UPI0007AFB156|nr:zinc finger protein jing homolog [Arachis ipaensis]
MDTDAQGARARRFKNRDNPSTRSTLRSRAPLSPTSTLFFFFSPPTAVAAAAPAAAARPTSVTVLGHQFFSPLTTTHPLSLPLTPLTHLTVTNPSAATPSSLPAARSLSILPAHSPIILLFHHHRPSSPQFLIPPAKPPRQPSSPPPFTAVPVSVSAAPALSMSDKGKAIASASKKRKRSKTSTPPPSANYARNPLNDEEKENQLLPSTDPTKFPNLYCELRLSQIAMDMLVLIGCVMEGKEVYFPRLIRHSMWRAHIRGLLPFPTLDTSLAELADVPPPTSRRSPARAAVEAAIPSSLTAAPPPSASEPTYLLVQRLFRFLERERLHVRRRLDRMDQALISLGAELPPLPDSPTSDEQDHQEEDADEPLQRDAPPAASDTTEPPQTHEVPEPQPEPEPIVVPPTDPPV